MSGKTEKIEWSHLYGPLTEQEQEIIAGSRKAVPKIIPKRRWEDLPPVLDPESIVTQAVLDRVVRRPSMAKVGDAYIEHATNVRATKVERVPITKHDRNSIESEEEVIVKQGWKLWEIIQPKWTEEDQKRWDKQHFEATKPYHRYIEAREKFVRAKEAEARKEFKDPKERKRAEEEAKQAREDLEETKRLLFGTRSKIWPQDRFPNGRYSTERWQPKVKAMARAGVTKKTKEGKAKVRWKLKWIPASDHDCRNWYKIPENRRRVDYLVGVLPDE